MSKHDDKPTAPKQIVIDAAPFGDESFDAGADLGSVQIHNSVIAAIARLAALRVPGVCDMSGGLVEDIAAAIGTRKQSEKGIRVEVQDDGVSIEMHLVLEYGVRIPHVAWQVQNDVRKAVEQMTGKTVRNVQVVVQGVRMPATDKVAPKREGSLP